jgi:signal transduction histidine kinase
MGHDRSVTESTPNTLAALQVLSQPEQLVAAFFNDSAVGLAICDDQLRYQAINETLAAMNGVQVEDHLGKTVRDILGESATVIEPPMKRVLATGRPVCNMEISVKLPTRLELGHWIENYFPIKDRAGKVKQVGAIVVEITDQRVLEASLRSLTRKLLRAQDEEQRRIARDLHDSINQYHVALKMNLLRLRRNGTESKRAELLAQSIQLLDHCMAETRTISYLLHPPLLDEMGFASATRWYAKGFAQRSGIRVRLHVPSELDRLPAAIEIALFRVLQEALTNVHRHARASLVRIDVERTDEGVMLQIRDDGQGIPPELMCQLQERTGGGSVGLASMHERVHELGGLLQIMSEQGTIVRAVIPIPDATAQDAAEDTLSAAASA